MRVLVTTCTAGYRHDYLTTAVEVLTRMGERNGFDVYATENCSELDKEMKGSSCVLFLTTGEIALSEQQKEWLVDYVREGGGFVGVHNAADTLYSFPRYHEMLGGTFNGHPWTGKVRVLVEDPAHASTAHLPRMFETTEEVYTFKDWSRDRTHVLIRLDNSSVDLSKGNRDDGDYALSWCHPYGDGKVFYTAFGHFPATWREDWFQRHLLGGIRWTVEQRLPSALRSGTWQGTCG